MKSKITLLDYLLAIPVAIHFWYVKHFDRSERCKDSPDGMHFYIVKGGILGVCKYCGKIEMPKRDARGARVSK